DSVLFDVQAQPSADIIIKPVGEQSEIESRRVWQKVSEALNSGNYDVASKEKTAIEEAQRALRKTRAETGEQWKPAMFHWVDDSSDEEAVRACYTYLYSAKESIGTGSWIYNNSPHLAEQSAAPSAYASGTQTPSDAFSTAPSSVL
ncbi:Oxysterol-binding protein 4, partial [Coemansia sp. S85]